MHRISALFVLPVSLLFAAPGFSQSGAAGPFTQKAFDDMVETMIRDVVDQLSVEDLGRLSSEKPVLLDTRSRKEFEVSHIPGARWAGYEDFGPDRVGDIPQEAVIITYCSVGYRSDRIAERLKQAGYRNVYNLKGGIFDWINKGKPVVDGSGRQTGRVHGYDEEWGKWIKRAEVVY